MKKIFCSLLFAAMMLFCATNICLAEQNSYLILKNQSFDDHKVGEKPNAFDWHQYNYDNNIEVPRIAASRDNSEVVKVEKDGNVDNLAAKLNAYVSDDGYTAIVRSLFNHYPIKEKGVISFSFRVEDFISDKRSHINTNVVEPRHVSFTDNQNYHEFITVKEDDVYFNGNTLIKSNISKDTWYRVDFAFDVTTHSGKLYFDGVATNVSLPVDVLNVSELEFELPTKTGSAWYIDDIKIYEASDVVADETIEAAWNRFTDSFYYFGYEFESGRAANYDFMAFLQTDGKRFSVIGTDRICSNNQIVKMPAKIYRHDGAIMVPVRYVAETMGAQVDWDAASGRVSVTYNGRTMEVAPNESIYYVNGKPAKLHYPAMVKDGTMSMQIDVLFTFLGETYSVQDEIIWFDEPREFDWHMPPNGETGEELWGSGNTNLLDAIYERMLWGFLFDRPTDEEVDTAIRTYSPNNQHPRIEVNANSFVEFKQGMAVDEKLTSVVNSVMDSARKYAAADTVAYETSDGKRASYTEPIKNYFTSMAFAYRMAETQADKDLFKNAIWRQIDALSTFPDLSFSQNTALGTGTMCHGLAYAYDWLYHEWTPEQRKIMEDMCREHIFEPALLAYNSSVRANSRDINYGAGNQHIITNGGILMLAISMYETDPDFYSDVIRASLRGTEGGIMPYFPNGEYVEGLSYWRYSGEYVPRVIKGLQTSMGQDFGRISVPGVIETALFPISMSGGVGGYAYGDASVETPIIPLFMFCADQSGNKELAEFRKQSMGVSGSVTDIINWVYDTEDYNVGLDMYDEDVYNKSNTTVIMKTGWGTADTSVSLHGGANNDPHGHYDAGSVQFDMSGVRFGMDLPRENYNLRDMGYYDTSKISAFWPNGYTFKGGHYYRSKGEGHNIVVANRRETNTKLPTDPDSFDVNPDGKTEFVKMEFGETSSFALLNMTDTNDIFDCAIRGVKLDKINNTIEIQDDFKAIKETDFLWSMHTYADIEISEDGKTAILTENNCKIKAVILGDSDCRFESLPAAFDTEYGTANKPPIETPNAVYTKEDEFYLTHGVGCDVLKTARKLAVKAVTGHFKLSVVFMPYVEGNTYEPEYVPFELWKNTEIDRKNLAQVTVNGVALTEFNPDNYNYSLKVVTQESEPPVIQAVAENSDVDVEIIQTKTVPGVTSVVLSEEGQTVGLYSFVVSPINDTTKFHSDKQLPIYDYVVTSEPQSNNPVKSLFDGDFETKFATDEQGGFVVMDLGSVIEGNLKLNIACLNGDVRKENFKIEYSDDGITYREAFNGSNSGTTTGLEQFDISHRARYVKVSFYGSSTSVWVSVTEMFVSNE